MNNIIISTCLTSLLCWNYSHWAKGKCLLIYRLDVLSLTHTHTHEHAHKHTHTHLTALFPGLPGSAGTRKVKPIWILPKQEAVSRSGISWAICKSAPSLQTDNHTSNPPLSFFTGRMPFLPPNQQRQSTEGRWLDVLTITQSALSYHFKSKLL